MHYRLKQAVVRIFSQTRKVVGGGFLASDRHVITCAHVINQSFGLENDSPDKPEGEITLDFPLIARGQHLTAEVVVWSSEDIAVLELKKNPPAGCVPVRLLYVGDIWRHKRRAFGFNVSLRLKIDALIGVSSVKRRGLEFRECASQPKAHVRSDYRRRY